MGEFKNINVNSIDTILDKINLIDIRENDEYEERSLKYTKNIPMHTLLDDPEGYLNMDDEYYIICETGRRSMITASELADLGYKVVNVSGGTSGYEGEKFNK